jgi:homoserine kinase
MRTEAERGARAAAFAPATVANVAAGFDVLGFALAGAGDRVVVERDPGRTGIIIEDVGGVVAELPRDPEQNTATASILSLLRRSRLDGGLRVRIEKGIPLGSGMGGSAASAVAGVVAANALLEAPLPLPELLVHAVAGEQVASGAPHADNAAPCLLGGMTAVVAADPPQVVRIPVPPEILCVLVRPHLRLDTRRARAVLPPHVPLGRHVEQSQCLAGLIAGCFGNDRGLIGRSMRDLVVEPARAPLIPGFEQAKRAALGAGALGFGIAGAGPSVFAWVESEGTARAVEVGLRAAFAAVDLATDAWTGPVGAPGARLESGS